MEYVKNFRDLEVYKLSRQLSKNIFEVSKDLPKEEMYSLTDQMRNLRDLLELKLLKHGEKEGT